MRTMLMMIIGYLMVINNSFPQKVTIPFESDRWDKKNALETEFLGRKCLMGIASLKDVEFENGVIEFDLAITGERSYPGITFRAQSQDDYERIYIRPHLPKTFQNVVQYEGTFNGIDSWQIYYGQGKTASATIPLNQWFHVILKVRGTQAMLFIKDSVRPVLTVNELAHGFSKGILGIWGSMDGSAFFSNFSFRDDNTMQFPQAFKTDDPLGIITDWEISQPDKLTNVDMELMPEVQGITNILWQNVKSLPSGLVDVSRYFGREGQSPDVIWAKTEILSDREQTKQYAFGYSDAISIFLNGKLLFMGNSSYTSRDANFQGIIGFNDYIFLPLKKGKNELMIAVAEAFGGWGFMFQDVEAIYEHPDITKQWEIRNKFRYPESVVYDKKRDVLYVSNYTYERDGFISKVRMNGEIEKIDWVPGILQPSGICIHDDKLYVVGRYNLVEVDIETQTITNRFPFPEPVFANDVTCDESGTFYVTDGGMACVYKLEDGKFTVWLKGDWLNGVNGILAEKNKLCVGTSSDGSLRSIDINTKEINTLLTLGPTVTIDGLRSDGKGSLLISDYAGRLIRVSPEGKTELLLNTKSRQITLADFEYISEKNMVVIPTFTDNRVMMYKLTE
jgi:sugar lactone lactonase YvrE